MFFYAVGILIINVVLAIVNFILRKANTKSRLVEYISDKVFHNLFIRFLIESYI